jgi:hypothetical protein
VKAATDLADTTLQQIRSGRKRTIRRHTRDAILAVTTEARADASLVSGRPTWRRIARLLDEGYTRQFIARALGSRAKTPQLQIRKTVVLASTELRVARLTRRLLRLLDQEDV